MPRVASVIATRSETFGCGPQETYGIPTQVTSLVTEDGSHAYSASLLLWVATRRWRPEGPALEITVPSRLTLPGSGCRAAPDEGDKGGRSGSGLRPRLRVCR
jgi:hypothetical protein